MLLLKCLTSPYSSEYSEERVHSNFYWVTFNYRVEDYRNEHINQLETEVFIFIIPGNILILD